MINAVSNFDNPLVRLTGKWGWMMAAGALLVVLGVLAFGSPLGASIGVSLGLGFVFLASGVVHLVEAFQLRKTAGSGGRFLMALISLVAGYGVLRSPVIGMMGVTIMLTFYLFMASAARWMFAAELRPHKGWGWLFLSSIVSAALGVFLIASFPISALWVPGMVLAVDLVISGVSLIAYSLIARSAFKDTMDKGLGEAPEETRIRRAA